MKRSLSLDILKIVLCLFVLIAHLQPLFDTRNLLEWEFGAGLARITVPCFFIINGLFLGSKIEDWGVIKSYLKHLLIIYAVWSLFYLYFYYSSITAVNLVLNLVLGYNHLWYLTALFGGVILLYLVRKYIKSNVVLMSIALLLFLCANTDELSMYVPKALGINVNSTFAPYFYRNALFSAFPFLTIGYFIKTLNVQQYFKSWHLVVIIIVSLSTLLLETYSFFDERLVRNLHLSLLFFSPTIILLCLKHPLSVNRSLFTEYFGLIPNGVYFVHVAIIFKLYSESNNIYNVPLVFLLSVLITIVLIFINKRIRIFL